MIDTNLEMTDKIGYLLFKKGIIDGQMLEKALQAKNNDKSKIKRNLAQILVQDFKFDHDVIFREVAILYAFRELETRPEDIPCLLYTSPSPRDRTRSRMPSSA